MENRRYKRAFHESITIANREVTKLNDWLQDSLSLPGLDPQLRLDLINYARDRKAKIYKEHDQRMKGWR